MVLRMMNAEVATASIYCFSLGSIASFVGLRSASSSLIGEDANWVMVFLPCAALTVPFALSVKLLLRLARSYINEDQEDVIPRALFLGTVFGVGLSLSTGAIAASASASDSVATSLGLYTCALSFFHYSEFLSTAWWNPKHLSVDSFLLNHSPEYHLALGVSWVEFVVEFFLFGGGGFKDFDAVAKCGLALIVLGEFCRKLAMWTAKANFNHLIQWEKNPEHVLVTEGIYSLSRHPSYVGWFLWSVGTQILLKNPVCSVVYALVSWRFFKERIHDEEHTLIHFFGERYFEYQDKVGTGLPGVKGLLLDADQKNFLRRKWARKQELAAESNDVPSDL